MKITAALWAEGHQDHKQVELRILGDENGEHLYVRNGNGLFDQVGTTEGVEACKDAAAELFGVNREAWEDDRTPEADFMKAYAQKAVVIACDRYETELDFTEESIVRVEEIMHAMYKQRPRQGIHWPWKLKRKKPDPIGDEMLLLMNAFGGYIGEVINHNVMHGEWLVDTERYPGESIVTLRVGETHMYPPLKVYKRLTDGKGESILSYYEKFKKLAKHYKL